MNSLILVCIVSLGLSLQKTKDYYHKMSILDEHCKFLIEQGVVEKLLALIKPVYGQTKCTQEHAALSALRNLAIPGMILFSLH